MEEACRGGIGRPLGTPAYGSRHSSNNERDYRLQPFACSRDFNMLTLARSYLFRIE
jgi:hypothetical protein